MGKKDLRLHVLSDYSKGNFTIRDLAAKYHLSPHTIHRYLHLEKPSETLHCSVGDVVVLMDTTYWGRNFGVVIMKDALCGLVLWFKFIERKEKIADYEEGRDDEDFSNIFGT